MERITRIKNYLDYLDKVDNYLEFEVAYVVKCFEDYTDKEITDDIIEKVYNYLQDLDEPYNEDFVNDIIEILN